MNLSSIQGETAHSLFTTTSRSQTGIITISGDEIWAVYGASRVIENEEADDV